MEERYNADGDAKQTDEFMKPVILDAEGQIKGEISLIVDHAHLPHL